MTEVLSDPLAVDLEKSSALKGASAAHWQHGWKLVSALPSQAVMSSDFAISHFRHLKKLLLVHGHWCYSRLARMVVYYFYKNVVSSPVLTSYPSLASPCQSLLGTSSPHSDRQSISE